MDKKYSHINASTNDNSTFSTSLQFRNDSDEELAFIWLDWDGNPQEYGRAPPGESYEVRTFSTHTWVIEDLHGKVWKAYQGAGACGVVNWSCMCVCIRSAERVPVAHDPPRSCHMLYRTALMCASLKSGVRA